MLKTTFPNRPAVVRTATEIDSKLIKVLQEDGRAIGRIFAQQTGLSEATISRRLAVLNELSLVRVRGYVDLQDSGCNAAAMIRISTTGTLNSFASALALRPCFYRVATVVGKSEVIALIACSTPTRLLEEIDSILSAHHDAKIEESSEILRVIPPLEARGKKRGQTQEVLEKSNTARRYRINASIIHALQRDYRISVVELANAAKISSPAAAAKLLEVIDQEVVRPLVVIDPHFLARMITVQLRISVRRNINDFAQMIAETYNSDWVYICLQNEQILIDLSVPDEVDLLRRQQEIKKIADVLSVTCSIFSSVFKHNFDWNGDEQSSPAS